MCFFPEKYIRKFSSSNGLLRPEKQSYRKSHGSPFSRCWRRTRLEGTNSFTFFKIFMMCVCLTRKVKFVFPFLVQKKGCLRLATHGSPTASSQSSATNMGMSVPVHWDWMAGWKCMWVRGLSGCGGKCM